MASRYVVVTILFLALSVSLIGCGGGGGQTQTTSTQRLQGNWVGTVHDPNRPAAVKCEVTISGSTVDGNIEAADGTVLGTIHGTLGDNDSIDVDFEFDGQATGENGTIDVNEETGELDINIEDDSGGETENGETTDSVKISLTRE